MGTFFMTVGASGSGKSTWAYEFGKTGDFRIVSSDALRKELFGNEEDQTHNKEVFEELHKRVRQYLREGHSVIYDATNLNRKKRESFLKTLPACEKACMIFPITYESIMKRMEGRSRKVPAYVVERQLRTLQMPLYGEGWDHIYFEPQEYKSFTDLADMMKNIPHDNPHHRRDIFDHSWAVGAEAMKEIKEMELPYNVMFAAYFASYLHDCGKPFTKAFKDSKGNSTSIAHYYGHEHYGAQLVLLMNTETSLLAAQMIDLHMEYFRMSENNLQKLEKSLNKCYYKASEILRIIHRKDEEFD